MSADKPEQVEESLPEVMGRIKDASYPQVKRGDVLMLQRVIGNKALRDLVAWRTSQNPSLQRHAMPTGRRGVGEEGDEIQGKREDQAIQRHAMPTGRRGIGEEGDEIQPRLMIQRQPGFGKKGFPEFQFSTPAMGLWGQRNGPTIQLKNGKGKGKGAVKGGPVAKKGAKVDPALEKAAKKEFSKFVAGGPYTITNFVPDKAVKNQHYGKFDVSYKPGSKILDINMKVKFVFPDLKVPKGKSAAAKIKAAAVKKIQKQYVTKFISHVQGGWSGKFTFKNVREPQSVWKKLNPIKVNLRVKSVNGGQHYIFNKYFKPVAGAPVPSVYANPVKGIKSKKRGTVHMYLFNTKTRGFTGAKSIGVEEIVRLNRNLPKIRFANSQTTVDAKYEPDLQFIGDYLKRMNKPKFNIQIIGHANKTGKEAGNILFSRLRAQSVLNKMKGFGVTNHKLTAKGVGSTGATKDGSWRKVDFKVTLDKSFSNIQDVDLHEFGHMLGLDDEYYRGAGDTRTHSTQQKFMQKMLGDKAYGKKKANRYADEVTKIYKKEGSASVMHGGDEVRVYHYVTFWQALYEAGAKGKAQPAVPFTWKDWKIRG